jgi:hypothetical protein
MMTVSMIAGREATSCAGAGTARNAAAAAPTRTWTGWGLIERAISLEPWTVE